MDNYIETDIILYYAMHHKVMIFCRILAKHVTYYRQNFSIHTNGNSETRSEYW